MGLFHSKTLLVKRYLAHCLNKSFLFCVLLVLSAVVGALIVFHAAAMYKDLSRAHWTASIDMIDQRLNSIIGEINLFPRTAGGDMAFLSGLSSLKNADLDNLEKDFLAFLAENTAYRQLAFVDQSQKLQMLVEFDGHNYTATRSIPQNLYSLEWLEDMGRLERSEVFISPIRLTKVNGEDTPIIIYAAPIYSDNLNKKGLVVGSVYANYFLDDIRAAQREGETVFLVDNQGNYLAHPDRAREFAYLFGRDDSFQKDYPQVASQILSNLNRRVVESDTHVFSFRAIYPTKGSFAIFKGAEKLEENPDSYFWVLVSVTDKKYLEDNAGDMISGAVIFAILSVGTLLGIAAVGYLLAFRERGSGGAP